MLKPTTIFKIKQYLTVLGLIHNSTKGNFESWEGKRKSVIICVSESEMPVFAIQSMLNELKESADAFIKITSVIH
jgi:hypothetical protein